MTRRRLAAAALPLLLLPACTREAEQPRVVEVVLDGGDDTVVRTAPVQVDTPPGAVLRVRNGNRGTSTTHLLTSAAPGSGPTLFAPVAGGALPNAAVWGPCLGGEVEEVVAACPVPPVEAPDGWDGAAYESLGAQLPGEVRELTLLEQLERDSGVSLWCRMHPDLRVDLRVDPGAGPSAGPGTSTPPVTARAVPEPGPREVLVAPADGRTERLAYAPAVLEVRVGQTVTWRVPGTSPHTVELGGVGDLADSTAADAGPAVPPSVAAAGVGPGDTVRSGFLSRDPGAPGSTFALRFRAPGTYRYGCRFHPQMTGEVRVTG